VIAALIVIGVAQFLVVRERRKKSSESSLESQNENRAEDSIESGSELESKAAMRLRDSLVEGQGLESRKE